MLAEGVLPTYEKAEIAVHLIDLRFDENEAFYAARECSDLSMAVSYLQQDCELCTGKFPMGKVLHLPLHFLFIMAQRIMKRTVCGFFCFSTQMISMLNCTHRCCRNCAKEYYTLKLKERNIMEAVCPFCNEPNLNDDDVATDYFNNLDIMVRNVTKNGIEQNFE